MIRLVVFIFLLLFSVQGAAFSDGEASTGSLIVTYQTGPKAERLDRIRFWLKNEKGETAIYPKSTAYVDDLTCMSRLVVIDNLNPGKYKIEFIIPNADRLFDPIPPREVSILPNKIIKLDQVIKPKYASIKVATSCAPPELEFETPPTVTLRNKTGEILAQSTIGKFVHRHLMPGKYEVAFETIPGFETPSPIEITIGPNEDAGPIEGIYKKQSKLSDDNPNIVWIQPGKVIMGDPFDDALVNELPPKIVDLKGFGIGIYEVTNAQFALWLNKALKEGKIIYHTYPEKRGFITDQEGRLLCKTLEGDPHSQIYTQMNRDTRFFLPVPGKNHYPVINVSWYGAEAYCKEFNYRLPTEAEWERAAGMEISSNEGHLRKYRYGFGQNRIDMTWANFRDEGIYQEHFEVKTTSVGFYNGINRLPGHHITTNDAKSPAGVYDMSGNVWEWVSDWYDDHYYLNMPKDNPKGPSRGSKKVAKGGCYDSLPDGVRVAERIGLPPDHLDPFTGFRYAVSEMNIHKT